MDNEQRDAKRRRTDIDLRIGDEVDVAETHSEASKLVKGTHIPEDESAGGTSRSSISPPPVRRVTTASRIESKDVSIQESVPTGTVPSPIHLSNVNGLPAASNVDTISLKDILGDPLIKECWFFNYLYDVDFML
ncbi:MAG: hypothetical protein LQ351_003859 [Letrouitia transgressa]|nr:MAG: hypothetical protein LQ351_003859 [Letrouitia transgressa]